MLNKNEKKFLQKTLLANGYDFSEEIQQQFLSFFHLLQQWNRIYNLTAIDEMQDMIYLHLLDSLSINPYLIGNRIIDVGTGAGFPGLPLAIIHPEKQFVLLDSNNKKTRFLTQVTLELSLKNVTVVHSRCEDYVPLEKFDSVMSRAFASLHSMLDNTQHLVADGGEFLAMKGVYPEQEIQQISNEFIVAAVHPLTINGLDAERHLVCLKKGKTE